MVIAFIINITNICYLFGSYHYNQSEILHKNGLDRFKPIFVQKFEFCVGIWIM